MLNLSRHDETYYWVALFQIPVDGVECCALFSVFELEKLPSINTM